MDVHVYGCDVYLKHFLQNAGHVKAEIGAKGEHAVEKQHRKAVAT